MLHQLQLTKYYSQIFIFIRQLLTLKSFFLTTVFLKVTEGSHSTLYRLIIPIYLIMVERGVPTAFVISYKIRSVLGTNLRQGYGRQAARSTTMLKF